MIGSLGLSKIDCIERGKEFDNQPKIVKIPSAGEEKNLGQEKGFSSKKYFITALAIATLAAAIFPVCFPASIVLCAIASWYLYSAVIILANEKVGNNFLETPIHQLYAVATEVNSGVAAAALFPLTFFNSYHDPKTNLKEGQPILMVNGYLSFGSTWHYMRQRLVKENLGPIYTINVGSGRSIKTYAEQIARKVEQIQKETNKNTIKLIGHSKGGLVCSYYATHLANTTKTKATEKIEVTDVVTIGSPLAGTSIAYLGIGYDVQEMRPNSKFNQELRDKIKEHSEKINFFHIASELDEIVAPSSALLGNNPSRKLLLKDMGHLGLIFSSRVANQVCLWLKSNPANRHLA